MQEMDFLDGLENLEMGYEAMSIIYENYYHTGDMDLKKTAEALVLISEGIDIIFDALDLKHEDLDAAEPLEELPERVKRP